MIQIGNFLINIDAISHVNLDASTNLRPVGVSTSVYIIFMSGSTLSLDNDHAIAFRKAMGRDSTLVPIEVIA